MLRFIMALSIAGVCLAGVNSPHQAAELVYTEILDLDVTGKVVYSFPQTIVQGETVSSWTENVPAPVSGYFVLIDDVAEANWEHHCRWVFVTPSEEMEVVEMTTPPDFLEKMTEEYSMDFRTMERSSLLDSFVPNPRETDAENCKALLISGGANSSNNHVRYYGDIQFIYLTLTQDYGYTNDDIIICFADGLNPAPDQSGGVNSNPDLDGDGTDDFDYDATLESVTNALAEMATLAGPDDHVLIFTTDHGGTNGGYNCFLNLWNEQVLNDDTFDTFIDNINSSSLHVVMEQCYSGAFEDEVIPTTGSQHRTFSSAARYNHYSYAGATFPEYDEWAYYWTAAMHGSLPAGGALPGDPDTNSDNYISYAEAWDFAFLYDTCIEVGGNGDDPQYNDDPDSCGDSYCLSGFIGSITAENSVAGLPAMELSLSENPVTSAAMVNFTLPAASQTTVEILDVTGRVISTPLSDNLQQGSHSVTMDLEDVPSGIYVIRLTSETGVNTLRAVKI
ncbi:hypothetical protein CSA37_04200 [Candidatus Fermentibacteria bacterium]|nr:MAG: hypothetical protein CSA37_04200 [Candidatus Fermentibacteria bacterium]